MKTLCYISIIMSTIAIIGNILVLPKSSPLRSMIIRRKSQHDLFKSIKAGNRPCLLGIAITHKRYNRLVPYVKDKDYLHILQSRIYTNS
jgi:hypothetical protein